MELINFKDMGLKPIREQETIKVNDIDITIVSYLPEDAKYDLIMIALQKAYEDGIYNPILLNRYFLLNIIYSYTGIVFTDEDRADEAELYDILYTNGIIDEVLEAIGPDELDDLTQLLNSTKEEMAKYNSSLGGFLGNTIEMLKEKLEGGLDLLKDFDMEKMQELLKNPQLAALLGGGVDKNLN